MYRNRVDPPGVSGYPQMVGLHLDAYFLSCLPHLSAVIEILFQESAFWEQKPQSFRCFASSYSSPSHGSDWAVQESTLLSFSYFLSGCRLDSGPFRLWPTLI